MKREMVDWVIIVLTDIENILKKDKLLVTAEALQDLQILFLSEQNKLHRISEANEH